MCPARGAAPPLVPALGPAPLAVDPIPADGFTAVRAPCSGPCRAAQASGVRGGPPGPARSGGGPQPCPHRRPGGRWSLCWWWACSPGLGADLLPGECGGWGREGSSLLPSRLKEAVLGSAVLMLGSLPETKPALYETGNCQVWLDVVCLTFSVEEYWFLRLYLFGTFSFRAKWRGKHRDWPCAPCPPAPPPHTASHCQRPLEKGAADAGPAPLPEGRGVC